MTDSPDDPVSSECLTLPPDRKRPRLRGAGGGSFLFGLCESVQTGTSAIQGARGTSDGVARTTGSSDGCGWDVCNPGRKGWIKGRKEIPTKLVTSAIQGVYREEKSTDPRTVQRGDLTDSPDDPVSSECLTLPSGS